MAGHLRVTQRGAGTNMSVDIAPGRGVIAGEQVAGQNSYLVTSSAVENRAVSPAPATDSRIDRVVARVRDAAITGTVNAFELEVIAGVVSATPVAPAVPADAVSLATVLVAAGTAAITDAMVTDTRIQALPPVRDDRNVGHALADAKGDVLVASATDVVARLPVGANGRVLTADSAAALGVAWTALPPAATPGHAIQDEGATLTQRAILNFVGPNVAATDDPTNNQTDVTISAERFVTLAKWGTD